MNKILYKIPGVRRFAQWVVAPTRTLQVVDQLRSIALAHYRAELLNQDRARDPKRLLAADLSVFSQTGADGIIQEIFRRIHATDRTFVEIGTESGVETNTTFLLQLGWSGWWLDGSLDHTTAAEQLFADPIKEGRLRVRQQFFTAENLEVALDAAGVPGEFDLLSLDIDRNTYWVFKALRRRPRVVVVEYNANIPASAQWSVPYDATKTWNGTSYFGAGLKLFELTGRELGYRLVGCDLAGFNAFFVRADLVGDEFAEPATAENHYEPIRGFLIQRTGLGPCFSD